MTTLMSSQSDFVAHGKLNWMGGSSVLTLLLLLQTQHASWICLPFPAILEKEAPTCICMFLCAGKKLESCGESHTPVLHQGNCYSTLQAHFLVSIPSLCCTDPKLPTTTTENPSSMNILLSSQKKPCSKHDHIAKWLGTRTKEHYSHLPFKYIYLYIYVFPD